MIKKEWIVAIVLLFPMNLLAQNISIYAGTGGGFGGDGGPATAAGIPNPGGGAFDKNGNYYFVNLIPGQRIRKINGSGIIYTVAGTGTASFNGDNIPATAATLNSPSAVRVDSVGNIYIVDQANNRIRKVDITTGIITTIVGIGTSGFGGDDGPATAALISLPQDICFDKMGNLYIGDVSNHRIRKVNTSGIITTVAGNGTLVSSGDNGPATSAGIRAPTGLAVDDIGNLYIADAIDNFVRKVAPSGIITTIAGGDGTGVYNGDEIPATTARLNPIKLAIDHLGQFFIADKYNKRVRKIDNSGIIHTVAGNGGTGVIGDGGPATAATIDFPGGLEFDMCGSLFITEANNQLVRKVTYPPILTTPTISLNSSTSSASLGSSVTINATVSNAGSSYIIHWLNRDVEFTTTTVPNVTYAKAAGTDTITARVVSTATYGCYDSTTSSGWVVTASAMATSGLAEGAEVLRMWPIPTKDVLHIDDVSVVSSYRVISMVGAMLLQGELKAGSNAIDVRDLPAGMYMVEITGNDGKRTVKKIIRQ